MVLLQSAPQMAWHPWWRCPPTSSRRSILCDGITSWDVEIGSDLTALDARRMLGLFVGFRARHWQDLGQRRQAARDYVLALQLFPNSQLLRRKASELAVFDLSSRP